MSERDDEPEKHQAALAAAALVESDMRIGLGTGSTAALMVRALGERVQRERLQIVGVATSIATAELARKCGITLVELDAIQTLDLVIDGADEVDPQFCMIKGRGGALLREKIVASVARRRVIMITPEKQVRQLGRRTPVPVEVSAFGLRHTENALRGLGAVTSVRRHPDGSLQLTDEGHPIVDCRFPEIADPEELDRRLNALVGVFETGLFVGLCDQLIVGRLDGADLFERPHGRADST